MDRFGIGWAAAISLRLNPAPGGFHSIRTGPAQAKQVTITVDQSFRVPGDNRELGMVLLSVGYVVSARHIADRRIILAGYRLVGLLTRLLGN